MAAQLTDMEELLAQVDQQISRDYMAEALKCYQAGACRACVVLCYIALFNDLRGKLAPLAHINSVARQVHQDIEQKANNQEVFEQQLSDQLASTRLIDAGQKSKLDLIIKLRNKSAHPSGFHASAEEARFVYYETIDKFLRHPTLQTTFAADAILNALPAGNYFPSNQIDQIAAVVKLDIESMHEQARPYFVSKLLELWSSNITANMAAAATYILGLASLKDDDWRSLLRKKLVVAKSSDSSYGFMIMGSLGVDPKLIDGLDVVTLQRVGAILENLVKAESSRYSNHIVHPIAWLMSSVNELGQDETWKHFETAVTSMINKYLYDSALVEALVKPGVIQDAYIEMYIKRLVDGDFDIAKPAANALPLADSLLGDQLSDEIAFRIFLAVIRSAESNTWAAQNIRNNKFAVAPKIKSKSLRFIKNNPTEAELQAGARFLTHKAQDMQNILEP